MLMFYVVAGALLLLSLLYWFMAVRINPSQSNAEQQALAQEQVNTYNLRLRELAYEQEHYELDDKEYKSIVKELKRQLLHDLRQQSSQSADKQYNLFVPGVVFLLLFVSTFYYSNGEYAKVDDWQKTAALLPELAKTAFANDGEPLTAKELQQLALGLRTKLADDQSNPMAWLMLGQVTGQLKDFDSAALALDKAYLLDPNKPATLLSYSEVLLMKADQASMRKAAGLLAKVLQNDPNNISGLFMISYIAEQMGDEQRALSTMELVKSILPADDPRMQYVLQRLGHSAEPATTPRATSGTTAVTDAKVTIKLSLDERLKDKVPVGATLFVYAKAAQGRPMPAAVVKLSEFSFPMTIELSDSNAMLQNYKLSTLDKIVVWSRVSVDGDIAIAQGELQGQSQVFSLQDTQSITVVINQVL
jgi:cytochrome c-type biogenesis protein CcmI